MRHRLLMSPQRGSVLIGALMILIVLTILVLVAMRGSTLMERLVGNSRQLDQAFQTAEAGLRQGEALLAGPGVPDVMATAGWYHYSAKPAPDWGTPAAWTDTGANGRISAAGIKAEFAIEELPAVGDPGGGLNPTEQPLDGSVFRISARGFGERGDTFVILQTTYRR